MKTHLFFMILGIMTIGGAGYLIGLKTGISSEEKIEKKIEVTEAQMRNVYQKGRQDTVDAVLNGLSGRDSVLIGKECSAPLDDKEWRYIYLGNKASPLDAKNAPLFVLTNEVGDYVITVDKEGVPYVNKEKLHNLFKKPVSLIKAPLQK